MILFRRSGRAPTAGDASVPSEPSARAGQKSTPKSTAMKALAVVAVIAALIGAGLGIRSLNDASGTPPDTTRSSAGALSPLVLSRSSTSEVISSLQSQLKENPNDPVRLTYLAQAYLQQIRENGDPNDYSRADTAIQKALKLDPKNDDTVLTLANLQFARHLFRESLATGQRAQALNPKRAAIYGVIGDSQVELGQYEESLKTYQTMVDLRPDLASYSRVSYARELHGDIPGAIAAMQLAVRAGGPGESSAAVLVFLGNLYLNYTGDLDNATRAYQQALVAFPNYVHAQAGLAAVSAMKGDTAAAIEQYKKVLDQIPYPQYLIALGGIYQASGESTNANRMFALVRTEQKLYQANGVDADLDIALFDADHGFALKQGLQRAQRAMKARPSVTTADVLAWTLYKNGKLEEAAASERQALRLGSKSAIFLFHAGMIASARGQKQEAIDKLQQSLSINAAASNQPYFDLLYGQAALAELTKLQGQTR